MDAVVSFSLATTNQLDPEVLPRMEDGVDWEERWRHLRDEWALFFSHLRGVPSHSETRKSPDQQTPSYDPTGVLCSGNQCLNGLSRVIQACAGSPTIFRPLRRQEKVRNQEFRSGRRPDEGWSAKTASLCPASHVLPDTAMRSSFFPFNPEFFRGFGSGAKKEALAVPWLNSRFVVKMKRGRLGTKKQRNRGRHSQCCIGRHGRVRACCGGGCE